MATATIIQAAQPLEVKASDASYKTLLKAFTNKYGYTEKDFDDTAEIYILKSKETAKQRKIYIRVEVSIDGYCRTFEAAKVISKP